MAITPQDVANAEQISELSLSNAGDRVVYSLGPLYTVKGEPKSQALWLAETAVTNSARKITSGRFNDQCPTFHPISSDIFFLSDRHKVRGPSQIYRFSSSAFGGEPLAVTPVENLKGVSTYAISPDGRWLAYISPDEPAKKDEEDAPEYVKIWREKKELGRLRLLDLSGESKDTRTIISVDFHVQSFTWSPDSTRILYRLAELPDWESNAFPVREEVVSILQEPFQSTPFRVHPHLPDSDSVWPVEDKIFYLDHAQPTSSFSLWSIEPSSSPVHIAFGDSDDAHRLVNLEGAIAVEVACGLETRIDVVLDSARQITVVETSNDSFGDWDIKRVGNAYVYAVVRSSGVTGEPENIWSGSTASAGVEVKLSSHHEWMTTKEMPEAAPFYWDSDDGTALQGVIAHPRGAKLANLPTVVVPHGGPYSRDVLHMRIDYRYPYLLASHGFLVLCPNYRGSQGRGNSFARASNGGMGTLDYADVESMLAASIERGYTDRDKVAIAGYSQGGFLSAWGCTRPGAIWKAGVLGAAPTDWGSMIICNDLPHMAAEFAGSAPWAGGERRYLQGSPMHDVKNVTAPLLLVHGEVDARVPVTQAIGFMRGLVREADKSVSDAATLVIYPREDHMFQERAHMEDQLTRVLAHIQKYLG
ncbi:alpha/beta-hydrolase [Mycena rebaudengoi]|nr:alpha/beta-hydrolase [Mycena rebaudengoi]